MLSDVKNNKTDYSLLAIVAGVYLIFVVKYQTTPMYVVVGSAVFAFFYFLWGILHHGKLHSLSGRVVLEYFLVATLGVAIVATLLV